MTDDSTISLIVQSDLCFSLMGDTSVEVKDEKPFRREHCPANRDPTSLDGFERVQLGLVGFFGGEKVFDDLRFEGVGPQ